MKIDELLPLKNVPILSILVQSEQSKFHRVLAIMSPVGLKTLDN